MKPINFPQQNMVLKKPDTMTDEECSDLPCYYTKENGFISVWTFDPDERAAIAAGADLYVFVPNAWHPPLAFSVQNPFAVQE